MRIKSYTPKSSILSNSVKCMFIIEQTENDDSASFLIVPSLTSYLSISLNTISQTMPDKTILIQSVIENSFDSDVQIGLKGSCVYKYKGKIKELCIIFQPLGIYNFFNERALLKTAENNPSFIPDNDYKQTLTEILNSTDSTEIFKKTEEYLLGRYADFSHPYLKKAMDELEFTDCEKPISIDELSGKLNITRQTLNNQFKKYLNLSPAEFRQINRFRKLIESKLISEKKSRLTEFVYEFGFFDQSHLIKEFQKYTFLKPNDFFKQINYSADTHILIIWQ